MIHKPSGKIGDDAPITGGIPLPARLEASFPDDPDAPRDDLGWQAYWLLKLHADVLEPHLRNTILSKLNDDAKRSLIAEIQRAIGVKPLKSDVI